MTHGSHSSLLFDSVRITSSDCTVRICRYDSWLFVCAGLSIPGLCLHTCPHSSVISRYRNFNLLSIGHCLSTCTLYLDKPQSTLETLLWIFGRKDSHLPLFTHSGILSSIQSTTPYRYCFFPYTHMLLYQCTSTFLSRCFSPGHFRRRTSRLVSYYALFECMAASEPTS